MITQQIKLIQKELNNYIIDLNAKDENGEEIYSHYRSELDFLDNDTETSISDLIKDADIESTDFNIGFEQGYMRGLEVAINLLTTNQTK